MHRASSILVLAVITLAPLAPLRAQDTTATSHRVPADERPLAALEIGTPVRIASRGRSGAERLTFAGWRGDSMLVTSVGLARGVSSSGVARAIPLASVAHLEMCPGPRACDGRGRLGMALGTVIGAVGGYLAGRALDEDCNFDVCAVNTSTPEFGMVIGAASGLALGGVIGALWPRSAWLSVRLTP